MTQNPPPPPGSYPPPSPGGYPPPNQGNPYGGQQSPPQGGVPYPGYQYSQNQGQNFHSPYNTQSNTPAVIALVLGILSFCGFGFLFAIPAIICGFIGKQKARELGGEGSSKAGWGIGLGIVNIIVAIIAIIAIVVLGVFSTPTSGTVVRASDVSITNMAVDTASADDITFSADLENISSKDIGYVVEIECESTEGETENKSVETQKLSPGDSETIEAHFVFDADTSYVSCEIVELTYS